MRLRPATPQDRALLERWDEQPHVLAADPNAEQLIAEVDGRPVGFVQIIDPLLEDSHYWGDVAPDQRAIDLWVGEAADLGKGYGSEMMRQALARCFAERRVWSVLVDPLATNTRAQRFYERLGFRFVARRRFGADECRVYRISRAGYMNYRKAA